LSDLRVFRAWRDDPGLLPAMRTLFSYADGDDRATGYLFGDGQEWAPALAGHGPALLDDLERDVGVRFEVVAFQAYLNGSGCNWHSDNPSFAQAILSLGVTRTFGVRPIDGDPEWIKVGHGDLLVMPVGFQRMYEHSVPTEDVPGERVSLVFRAVVRS
jgi:alkylated DNA repair dioxygenase AlkB